MNISKNENYNIHNNSNKSLDLAYCGWEECSNSHSFGPATRPHYLIHYITSGKGTYYVNDKIYTVKKGEAFLIVPGQSTIYTADETDPWTYIWIGFNGDEAKRILDRCGYSNDNLVIRVTNGMLFENALKKLLEVFDKNNTNTYTLTGNLYICLSYLINDMNLSNNSFSKTYFEKAVNYIHTNYCYDIKINDIAKYIGIDRTYLYKIFLSENDLSPQQYLINYRLFIATNLLKEGNLNITEIAFSCGFKDVSSFNKHFKSSFKTTPLKYKKNPVIYLNNE